MVHLHIHHGYIGAALISWSALAVAFGAPIIGEYNPWLALVGFLVGVALFFHDLIWHLTHRGGK